MAHHNIILALLENEYLLGRGKNVNMAETLVFDAKRTTKMGFRPCPHQYCTMHLA